MNFEYYAYGNSGFLFQVFNAIAGLINSDGYGGLITTSALLAFLIVLGISAFKLEIRTLSTWFFGVIILWYGFMLPKVNVIIVDKGGSQAPQVVANVPLGIAAPAHYASSVGDWLTRSAETVFSLPSDLQYSKNGMLFGSRLYQAMRSTTIEDSILQTDWSAFMYNCAFYDMAYYHLYSVRDLSRSQDILTTLGRTNQALFVAIHKGNRVSGRWGPFSYNYYQYNQGTTSMSCDEAYVNLKARTIDETRYLQLKIANTLYPLWSSGSSAPGQAVNKLVSGLETTYRTFFRATSTSALQAITQEAMINVVRTAEIQNARTSRDSEKLAIALSVAQAERQTLISMKTSGSLAAEYLPLLRNTLEGLLIALFPVIIVLSIIGIYVTWSSLMYYFMALIWIQLWPMLYAILNLAATANTESNVASWLTQTGPPTLIDASPVLKQFAQIQAMAGNLIWAIPFIAATIVMGAKGLASAALMGKTASAGESNSTTAGTQTAQGNVSLGNVSANNTVMNHHATDSVYATAGPSRIQGATGSFSAQAGVAGSFRSPNLPVAATSSASESQRYSEMASRSQEAGKRQEEIASSSVARANSQIIGEVARQGFSSHSSQSLMSGMDASERNNVATVLQSAQSLATKYGIRDHSSVASSLGLSLGISGSTEAGQSGKAAGRTLGAKLGLGADGTQSAVNSFSKDFSDTVSSLHQKGVTFGSDTAKKVSSSKQFQDDHFSGKEYTQAVQNSLTQSETATRSATNHYAEAKRHLEMAERSAASEGRVQVDGGAQVAQAFANNSDTMQTTQMQPVPLVEGGQKVASGLHQGVSQKTEGTTMDTSQGGLSADQKPGSHLGGVFQSKSAQVRGSGKNSSGSSSGQSGGSSAMPQKGQAIQNQLASERAELEQNYSKMTGAVNKDIGATQDRIFDGAKNIVGSGKEQLEKSSSMHVLGNQLNQGSGSQQVSQRMKDQGAHREITEEARRSMPKTPLNSKDYQPWRPKK